MSMDTCHNCSLSKHCTAFKKSAKKTKYCKTKAQNWFVMEAIIEKLFSTLNEIVEEKNKHDFN